MDYFNRYAWITLNWKSLAAAVVVKYADIITKTVKTTMEGQ